MSTHIPADYFSKPVLADLGVGKRHGCNGWIVLPGAGVLTRDGNTGAWVPQTAWDHDGIDSGTRAICGVLAPSNDRTLRVEGPLTRDAVHEAGLSPYGKAVPAFTWDAKASDRPCLLVANFPGERTIGHLWHEGVPAWRARARSLYVRITGSEPGGLHTLFPDILVRSQGFDPTPDAKWRAWAADHEAELRQRWALRLPPVPPGSQVDLLLPKVPNFAAIDCAGCLAAWDVFSAHTGATVEVAPGPERVSDICETCGLVSGGNDDFRCPEDICVCGVDRTNEDGDPW